MKSSGRMNSLAKLPYQVLSVEVQVPTVFSLIVLVIQHPTLTEGHLPKILAGKEKNLLDRNVHLAFPEVAPSLRKLARDPCVLTYSNSRQ
jgi:hypothetical protein